MSTFVLYLLESGLCLSLLYLIYLVILKNETYFTFIRMYLLSSILFALFVPLVHVTFFFDESDYMEETFGGIGKVRSYYTDFLMSSEYDTYNNKYRPYQAAVFEGNFKSESSGLVSNAGNWPVDDSLANNVYAKKSLASGINLVSMIIWVYATGVLIFLFRLGVLFFWLFKAARNNPVRKQKDYRLVLMNQDIPPFSFFRNIFINKETPELSEFNQILAHEQIHVKQFHSYDLLLAHAISVFHWFNPLVWRLQTAIKTTHEYIADENVVKQGFELFDYQSLLLKQLISIRSVALVNNFNLISIKKRITMMTKSKSGLAAKLKALLIIPAAVAVFFLFAHTTIQSPVMSFTNFSMDKTSKLDGLWQNASDDAYGKLLLFNGNSLTILESSKSSNVIDLTVEITGKALLLINYGGHNEKIPFELTQDKLKLWWSDNSVSEYKKTPYKNSSQVFLPEAFKSINLPLASELQILERPELIYNIFIDGKQYHVDGVSCSLHNLEAVLIERIGKFNVLNRPYATAALYVDAESPMKPVYDLYQVLRKLKLYKIAYRSIPTQNISLLQYHVSALPQMLPPSEIDGAVMLDKDKEAHRVFEYAASDDPNQVAQSFEQFIKNRNGDYIAVYSWDNATRYGDYLKFINMAFEVIYKLRNDYSMEKYQVSYANLSSVMQKDVRSKFPMRITQTNRDEEK
jgi:hypothetical protein